MQKLRSKKYIIPISQNRRRDTGFLRSFINEVFEIQAMKSKLILVGLLVLLGVILMLGSFIKDRIWWGVSTARLSYSNKEAQPASVYTKGNGDALIFLGEDVYIVRNSTNDIQVRGNSAFFKFSYLVFSYDQDPKGVSVKSGKLDTPHPFSISNTWVEFTDLTGNIVRVDY